MKKADPVSSKSLCRCLRVLAVFVYLYYSKKNVFCQELCQIINNIYMISEEVIYEKSLQNGKYQAMKNSQKLKSIMMNQKNASPLNR